MTNLENKAWVTSALAFWKTAKPNRLVTKKTIKWNIEMLTKALEKL